MKEENIMSKLSKNGKYVVLDSARLSFDPSTNIIRLTAKDGDLSKGFALTLNTGTETEQSARELLKSYNLIPEATIPKYVRYEAKSSDSFSVYLGESAEGAVSWDVEESPHALVVGGANSGRTVVIQNIVSHAIQFASHETPRDERWTILLSDTNSKMLDVYADNEFVQYGDTVDEMVSMIEWTLNELIARKNANQGIYSPILLVVDDIFLLRYSEDTTELSNSVRSRVKSFLDVIAEFGGDFGVHVVFSTANYTRSTLNKITLDYITTSITVGPLDEFVSENVHGEEVDTSDFRGGRSLFSSGYNTAIEFQPAYDKNGRWLKELLDN